MTSRLGIYLLAVTLALGLAAPEALAGVAGKVTGKVTDRDTGEGLAAANVSLVGTLYGASTDDDGNYYILNVPAGGYDLRVDYIGYKSFVLRNVKVSPDLTTRVPIALEATALEIGAETVVIAERELIQPSITNSYRVTSGEELEDAPIRGYQQAVAINAGVVTDDDGDMHFRGGRGNEIAFYVDGVLQNDLLSGTNNTDVSSGAIEEVSVQNGGFNAEYGYTMSGIVNVVTKSGREDWTGRIEAVSDALAGEWANTLSFGYSLVNASAGGPLGSEKLTLFGSLEYQNTDDRNPSTVAVDDGSILNHNALERLNGTVKLTYKPTESLSLQASYLRSQRDQQNYTTSSRTGNDGDAWRFNQEHAPRVEDYTNNLGLKGTLFFGTATFAEAQFSYFETDYQDGDGVYFDDLAAYAGHGETFDNMGLFITPGSAFDDYRHRNSRKLELRTSIVHQFTDLFADDFDHEVKTGVDLQRHTLRSYRNAFPSVGNRDIDAYGYDSAGDQYDGEDDFTDLLSGPKEPVLLGAYLQDKMEFEDLVVNAGVRFDYLDSKSDIFKSLSNEPQVGVELPLAGADQVLSADDFEPNEASTQVSPRLGISFPVSEQTQFHLNYGHFFQQPNLNDLYSGLAWYNKLIIQPGFAAQVGNPNLEAQRTTSYEVGVKHEPSDGMMVDVTAFYRDTEGLINLSTQDGDPAGFIAPFNLDVGTNKGVDVAFEMLRRNKISGRASYTLSFASGTGSSDNSAFNNVWLDFETAKSTKALDFDQRHTFNIAFDVRNSDGDGPELFDTHLLENAGVNFIVQGGSGLAYTATNVHNAMDLGAVPRFEPVEGINQSYRPWNVRVDMKANKEFRTSGASANVYVEVLNLFNRANAIDVYTGTGTATDDGYLGTAAADAQIESLQVDPDLFRARYSDRLSNPFFWDIPRLVRVGMVLSF